MDSAVHRDPDPEPEPEWVTDLNVIATLIQIGEIREGDEVMLGNPPIPQLTNYRPAPRVSKLFNKPQIVAAVFHDEGASKLPQMRLIDERDICPYVWRIVKWRRRV